MASQTMLSQADGHAPFQPLLMMNPTAPTIFIHWYSAERALSFPVVTSP